MIFCEAKPYQNADDPSVHPVFRGKQHVHLMGDDARELRLYAASIGLKISWIQCDNWGLVHFDCTGKFMKIVMADKKVKKLDRNEFIDMWRKLRKIK